VVYVTVVLVSLAVVALGAWAVRRLGRVEAPLLHCSGERLGIRDRRDPAYGPPSSL
jgi:hypothetical protein